MTLGPSPFESLRDGCGLQAIEWSPCPTGGSKTLGPSSYEWLWASSACGAYVFVLTQTT